MFTRQRVSNNFLMRFFSNFRKFSVINNICIKEEVKFALENAKPIVALESTIITHGMPYPENIRCALEVEEVVRKQDAIPATIAIINGTIKVGLENEELQQLGDTKISKPIKTSRRDLAFVVSQNLNGGTTVSGTIIIASKVGLPIFATGGIGGVHRGAETTFDVSADLTELGRNCIAVISSGVKSILDIPKTLEYLETQGVFVATFGDNKEFPAFYTRQSGSETPYSVTTTQQAAHIIHFNSMLNLQSGMLFAVPVPEHFSLDLNDVIQKALSDAKGVSGKEITPFLLGRIADITEGKSLETNIALIKNNAKVASDIAVELTKIRRGVKDGDRNLSEKQPVIIGGSNLDCSIKLKNNDIKFDGRMHQGKFALGGGGVGRNMCEALCKLGCQPTFLSVIGDDEPGRILKNRLPKGIKITVLQDKSTAQCTVVLDSKGDSVFLMGDMDIHKEISQEMIKNNEILIKNAPLLILDGNLTVPALETALKLADTYRIPVFYEPTDIIIANKAFLTSYWQAIKYITPNLDELRQIATHFNITLNKKFDKVQEAALISKELANFIDTIIVTLGSDGLVIARKGEAFDPLFATLNKKLEIRYYPVKQMDNVVNVSGAGDCLASGLIAGMLNGLSEEMCVSVGFEAALKTLMSTSTVADVLLVEKPQYWGKKATYTNII